MLVPGDGEGRNGIHLAQQGHQVLSVDVAASGLRKAADEARRRGVAIDTLQADLATWAPTPESTDAVVLVFVHLPPALRPRVHRAMAGALRPGGLLVLEGFEREHFGRPSGGPRDPDWLFDEAQLTRDFDGLSTEALDVHEVDLDDGPFHQGSARVIRGRWRKPGGPQN